MNNIYFTKLAQNQLAKSKLLTTSLDLLAKKDIRPKIGLELEFYLINASQTKLEELLKELNPFLYYLEKEVGTNQFELKLAPTRDLFELASEYNTLKSAIKNLANFSPKPFEKEPPSGVHINISLYDKLGRNLLEKTSDEDNILLLHAVGGILSLLKESMFILNPTDECYKRFGSSFESPTRICWGPNNRTVAIRVPVYRGDATRIEHRVVSNNNDIYLTLAVLLLAINYGIEHKINPGNKIFGNANKEAYNLEPIPNSLATALKEFEEGQVIKPFIEEHINDIN